MKKMLFLSVAFSVLALFSMDAVAGTLETKFDAKIGGYVKLDYITQDAALGPLTLRAPAEGLPADRDESILTAKQSRLNLIVTGPDYLGAKTRAFIEGDFYGSASNSSGALRMRHANFTLDWKERGTQLMFGQFWDIFGPFAASTLDFRTGASYGAPNNPRVAQARVTQDVKFNEENWVKLIAGVQNPVDDNEEGKANFAGQAMFHSKALGVSPGYWGLPMQPLIAGVFGLYGDADVDATWGAGFYTHVPILNSDDGKSRAMTLSFEGQAYVAEGLKAQNATAAHTIGTPGVDEQIAEGYGAIGQLIFYPTQPLGITLGFGRRGVVDTEDYRNLAGADAELYNESLWANVTYDVGNVRFGAEYMRLNTGYNGIQAGATDDEGEADRIQLSAIYFF